MLKGCCCPGNTEILVESFGNEIYLNIVVRCIDSRVKECNGKTRDCRNFNTIIYKSDRIFMILGRRIIIIMSLVKETRKWREK